MKRHVFLILLATLLLVCALPAVNKTGSYGKITEFKAEDVPFDDGSGVMLNWKPLPHPFRIIQYRIYRGVSPDTLFLLSQIDTDPATSGAVPKMFFYDKDFQLLLSIDNPGSLKKEQQQDKSSPLFAGVPRDGFVIGKLLPHYSVLGIINNTEVYYHSRKYLEKDGTAYAGVKVNQFEQLAANPVPGETYYYTVLAVDEKGVFLPPANIAKVSPYDNPPDNSTQLSVVYVPDSQQINFEWVPSILSLDIALWQFYLVPKSLANEVRSWKSNPSARKPELPAWLDKAILIDEKPFDYQNFAIVKLQNGIPVRAAGRPGKPLPINNLQDYEFVMGVQDYAGFTAYSIAKPLRILSAGQLPKPAVFTVVDKPDDKGDTSVLSFGQPITNVAQAYFLNKHKTRMRLVYDISANLNETVHSIIFKLYAKDGSELATVNEHYPDKMITVRFAKPMDNLDGFVIKSAFYFKGKNQPTDFYIAQTVYFDTQTRRYTGGDITLNGMVLNKYSYQILRQNKLESTFTPTKKIAAIARNYDDIVNYESTLQKQVFGVDDKTGRLLLDSKITYYVDNKRNLPLQVSLYPEEQQKEMNNLKQEIAKLRQLLAAHPVKADSLQQELAAKQQLWEAYEHAPGLKEAHRISSQHRWIRTFVKIKDKLARSYAYQVLKTDNEAGFSLSQASPYFLPKANLFDWSKLLALIASLVFGGMVIYASISARRGGDLYIRPIAGLAEIDNAVGRATEMGRPILYVTGLSSLGEISTIASLMILNRIAIKVAEYDTRLLVPCYDYYVMPLAQEIVRESYSEAGRPDAYNQNDVYFVSNDQFPYVAGVNGAMIREKSAANFYMGYFAAEALLMTETGFATGSIQIAGTDAITQVPFFITTCDYTLIGEEFYAASAYLSKDPELVSMLKAQDYFKFLIVFFILVGSLLASAHFNWLTNVFPLE